MFSIMHQLKAVLILKLLAILTASAFNIPTAPDAIKIDQDFAFTVLQGGPNTALGVVNSVATCGQGELGTFIKLRYEACSSTAEICEVPGDSVQRPAQLSFKPSKNIAQLGARISVKVPSQPEAVVVDKAIADSTVSSGLEYQLNAVISASSMFKGRQITIKFELYDVADSAVQICILADFKIV